jgi:hypothetical protein
MEHVDAIPVAPAIETPITLDEYLQSIGLDAYLQPLLEFGVESAEDLCDLEESDLPAIVSKPLHQRRLLEAIASLRMKLGGAPTQSGEALRSKLGNPMPSESGKFSPCYHLLSAEERSGYQRGAIRHHRVTILAERSDPTKPTKTILVLGATGSGKVSSLILAATSV